MPSNAADMPFDDDIDFDPPVADEDEIDPNGALIRVALRAVSAAYREHALDLVIADRRTPGRRPEEDVALGLLRYQLMIDEFEKWEIVGSEYVPAEKTGGRKDDKKRRAWIDAACGLARELSERMPDFQAIEEARAAANRAFEFLQSEPVKTKGLLDPEVWQTASVFSPGVRRFLHFPPFGSDVWSSAKDKAFVKDLRVAYRTRDHLSR